MNQSILTKEQAQAAAKMFGTPLYVYSEKVLAEQAAAVLSFPNAYGLLARFAMKACPTRAVIQVFHKLGLHFDASSGYEAERIIKAGIPASHIRLTSQELPKNLAELVSAGIHFTACSLQQLKVFRSLFPENDVAVRINPGLGSGMNNRTNVGGLGSSFGIWHEHLEEVLKTGAKITFLHSHIGAGADPQVWLNCAQLVLGIAARMPDVQGVSLGGGFKVARMPDETSADLMKIGNPVKELFQKFAQEHKKKLSLEIEPGTFLTANAGALLMSVIDISDTGKKGYKFIKVDGGMTELLRPSIYGAQHAISLVPATKEERATEEYLVVGHCCESGDIFTPEKGDPEGLRPRMLPTPNIGDLLVVDGSGAYGLGFASKNYNSFPEAAEVILRVNSEFELIKRRQTLEQQLANEYF